MSRYLGQFTQTIEETKAGFELYGDCILVERIPEPERKIGSIILAPAAGYKDSFGQDKPHFVRVLAVGEGYYDDVTKESTLLNVDVGDIILVGQLSVRYFSIFGGLVNYEPDSIGITRESEIQMRFKGQDEYERFFSSLNKHAPKKVE